MIFRILSASMWFLSEHQCDVQIASNGRLSHSLGLSYLMVFYNITWGYFNRPINKLKLPIKNADYTFNAKFPTN